MNRKGFALLEVLIFVVVLGLAVGGGWYVTNLKKQQSATNTEINVTRQAQQAAQQGGQSTQQGQGNINQIETTTQPLRDTLNPITETTTSITSTSSTISSTSTNLLFAALDSHILYPGFEWVPATSTWFADGSNTSEMFIFSSSGQGGFYITTGKVWQSKFKIAPSEAEIQKMYSYYTSLYSDYVKNSMVVPWTANLQDNLAPSLPLGDYTLSPLAADGAGGGEWGFLFKNGVYENSSAGNFTKDIIRELTIGEEHFADGGADYVVFWGNPVTFGEILASTTWNP